MDLPPAPQQNPLLSPPELTPLEQEVLEEYEQLAANMKKVRACHFSVPPLRFLLLRMEAVVFPRPFPLTNNHTHDSSP